MPLSLLPRSVAVLASGEAAVIVMLYALALYFQAATASLSNAYQPGIEVLRAVVSPGGLLLVVFLIACLRKSYAAIRVATLASAGALFVSTLMLVVVAGHGGSLNTWQFPEARSLSGTVYLALFQPSFSNRSIGAVAGNGFLALLALGGSAYLSRRRHNQSVQRTGPDGPPADLHR